MAPNGNGNDKVNGTPPKDKAKKAPPAPGTPPRLKVNPKLNLLQDVIALMAEAQINEILFEQSGVKIHLRKGFGPPMESFAPTPVVQMAPSPMTANGPASSPSAVPAEEQGTTVKAPMVGTFYRAPAPDSKPFIQEGQTLEVGQVFCIIEAMKLMNEIKSDVAGRVVKILASNGQAVEFGQPLLVVEPA